MDERYYRVSYADNPYVSLSQYMSRTFSWMFLGLLTTFAVAMAVVFSGAFLVLYRTGLVFLLTIAELVLVGILSAKVYTLRPSTAMGLFFGYAVLNGINLSVYFIVYDLSTLLLAFLVGAVYFGIMAVYGKRTGKDLSGWGPMLMCALVTLLVFTLAGSLLS
ncbi:MAG: Bax inhibitor-1 family protein, partial [Gemmiger sp.]